MGCGEKHRGDESTGVEWIHGVVLPKILKNSDK